MAGVVATKDEITPTPTSPVEGQGYSEGGSIFI